MTDHVAVRIVQDDGVVFVTVDGCKQLVGDFIGAHLGLEVIGGDGGGFDKDPVLAGVLLLNAAVEEEGYMSVFLGLGNPELLETLVGDILAEGVFKRLGLECYMDVRHGCVVLSHADIIEALELLSLEAAECGVDKGSGDLSRSVGAEVKENDRVVILDGNGFFRDCGHDKFIGHVVCVGFLQHLAGAVEFNALALGHGLVSLDDSLPAVVSVHGVVSAHDGCDLAHAYLVALLVKLGEVILA